MEEIEKLEEFNWVSGRDAITIALCNTIIRKQNEIIDHLNSQDQEEEKIVRSKEDMERTDYTGYPYSKEFQSTTWDTLEEINPYEKITKEYAGAFAKDEEKGDIKRLREEVKDTPEEITAEQLCEDNRKRMERLINKEMEERGFIRKIKDTPEQKEEWEEELRELLEMHRGIKSSEWETLKTNVVYHVQSLLDERETKAFNEGVKEMEDSEQIQADWDIEELGNIVDKIVKKLSKLNKKK